jgi:hypothetical protein
VGRQLYTSADLPPKYYTVFHGTEGWSNLRASVDVLDKITTTSLYRGSNP